MDTSQHRYADNGRTENLHIQTHGIADISIRCTLKVVELKRIQGFPDKYILKGNTNDQKKFIGNSVETGVVRAWLRAIANQIPHAKNISHAKPAQHQPSR